jgi:ribosomal protein S18 acetylase RimI-like enzyme
MKITIEKGNAEYLEDCEEALLNSELGKKYFTGNGNAEKAVKEGLEQGTLYISKIYNDCVGFLYYIPNGIFHSFPLLHLLVVKEAYRGKGIGKKMLEFVEKTIDKNKLFLVVADFNPDAKRFYEKNGYRQVGEIPNLYRDGITEYLMLKEIA